MKATQHELSASDSIFCSVRWPKAKPPRRAAALDTIKRLMPWAELEAKVRPYYASDTQKAGRPGVSLRMLIHCFVLQHFWALNDYGLEAFILDSHAAAKFIGSDPWQPRPPSASRMRDFRRFLENHMLDFELRAAIAEAVYSAGLQVRPGCIAEPIFRRSPGRVEDRDSAGKNEGRG